MRAIAWVGLAVAVLTGPVLAEAPQIKSGTPMIHLADNLDEKDRLGWCIDTVGRGFGEDLHAHSCKPDRGQANDTQFLFDEESGQIRSVAFVGRCMTTLADGEGAGAFGLRTCGGGDVQVFRFDAESGEIGVGPTGGDCVVVGGASRSAGPFMSRDLTRAACDASEDAFKRWVVLP